MSSARIVVAFLAGSTLGGVGGWLLAAQQAKVAVLAGPYSDNYRPALTAIAEAQAKLQTGNTNVIEQLQAAEAQIRSAQDWSRRFLGLSDENN